MSDKDREHGDRKLRELEALYRFGQQRSALRVTVAATGAVLCAALLWSTALTWRDNLSLALPGLVLSDIADEAGTGRLVAVLLLLLLILATATAAWSAWEIATVTAVVGAGALAGEIVLWVQVSRDLDGVGPGLAAAPWITFVLLAWAIISARAIRRLGPEWAVTYHLHDSD